MEDLGTGSHASLHGESIHNVAGERRSVQLSFTSRSAAAWGVSMEE
jgi:hypothetical protein